jgi:hypothetical protein
MCQLCWPCPAGLLRRNDLPQTHQGLHGAGRRPYLYRERRDLDLWVGWFACCDSVNRALFEDECTPLLKHTGAGVGLESALA